MNNQETPSKNVLDDTAIKLLDHLHWRRSYRYVENLTIWDPEKRKNIPTGKPGFEINSTMVGEAEFLAIAGITGGYKKNEPHSDEQACRDYRDHKWKTVGEVKAYEADGI
jgi:hypothetical protein